jgi:hypothetical protein
MKIEAAGGSGILVYIRIYGAASNKKIIFINVFVRT